MTNRNVRIDDMTGVGWVTLGTSDSGTGEFDDPDGITIDDKTSQIYVACNNNNRIVRING